MYGGAGDDTLYGLDGGDDLFGELGNDVLWGGNGLDILDGGAGADLLIGGTANDTYIADSEDIIIELANEGTDIVMSYQSHTLFDNVENLTLMGTDNVAGIGNAINNIILGNSGNNLLDGGAGVDTLRGGLGNDTYIVDSTTDVMYEVVNSGIDTVLSSVSLTLLNNFENLTLTGTGDINASGNTFSNILIGNSGKNVLDGLGGADHMSGGAGDDTYVVNDFGDTVVEFENEGIDTVITHVNNYVLAANIENVTIRPGASGWAVTGNDLDNIITGSGSSDTLYGLDGDDLLNGLSGNDTMIGGLGNDLYIVAEVGDVTIENAGEGTDSVQAYIAHTLSANIENLTLMGTGALNGTGNGLDNVLTGNGGNNTLSGLSGNDTMIGGLGNDLYIVAEAGDVTIENAGEGTDSVQAYITHALSANIENLTLMGTGALNGTGNGLDNVLTGNSAANTLNGLDGDDLLNGLSGNDTMIGGLGNDLYIVAEAGDVTIENAGEGTDSVQAYIAHTLSANIENLTLMGTGALNGTGNGLDNILIGNDAANTLIGGDGDDTLSGAGGSDVLSGGIGNDTYILRRGDSSDTITESDATMGNTDTLSLGANISADQLWFRQVGNSLEVSVIGTSDKVTINSWYSGSANQLEQFQTTDGKQLVNSQVDNLVQAMAAFAPPTAGQTTLPQNYQDQLSSVIAANWQ